MAALLIGGSAMAAPVSVSDAKQKALSFVRQQAAKVNNPRKAKAMQNAQLTEANAFGNELHIFNVGGNNGFVIVSGDDRTEEILGYVDCGNFDINTIPANMKAWLQGYVDQIKFLGNSTVVKATKRIERAAVAPTCATHWDQTDPFNNYILDDYPEQDKFYHDNLMTGCVATAMAQAMYTAARNYKAKHGDWPQIPTHKVPAYNITESGITSTGWKMPELPEYTFDWENMRTDNYSDIAYQDITDEQKKAVGKLMQYCGRAMKMEYDKINSASVTVWVAPRLYDCLNVSKFVQSVDRAYYNSQDWEDMMYKEVSEGRSVIYAANVGPQTNSEGHCFILDGYQDGLWHINWGWGKSVADFNGNPKADGYFSLSVMQPMAAGSGSASVLEAQYKYLQQAIIGVSYDDPEDGVSALNFYWNGKNVYTSYVGGWGAYNVLGATINYEEGWAIRNADGTISDNIWNKTTEYEYPSIGIHAGTTAYFSDMNLPTEGGEYDIVHISREKGTTDWHASYGTDKNYVTITIADGKVTKAVAHPVDVNKDVLSVKSVEYIGDMEANKNNMVKVTIENTGDDFFGTLAMYYSAGTNLESTKKYDQLATIKPGETTHEFTVNLPKGEYNLWFIANPSSFPNASSAFGTAKMFIGYGADANKIQAGNLKFDGQTGSQLEVKSVNGVLANEVTGSFDITNSSGHIYNNTYYVAVEYGSGNSKKTYTLVELPVSVEEGTHSIPFNLGAVSGLESGITYKVRLYSKNGDEEVDVTTKDMALQPYFRYWIADGTIKEAKEPTSWWTEGKMMDPDAKANAVAIDLKGIKEDYIRMTDNPNCLFYLADGQKLDSDFSKANKVLNGAAEKITIDGSYSFYAPEGFTVEEATYTRKFANGNNNDGKGWETIILPFKVNSVKNGNKNLQWFKSSTDKRKHFWVMEFTDAKDNDLVFDYAQNFEANTPYLISVPGNKWGDNWDLTNKDITFRGVNVTVPASVLEPITYSGKSFVGMLAATTVNGWILNDEGTNFEQKEAEVKGFNAYITTEAAAPTMRIIIADATGIINVETEDAPEASSAIYNLNGMRVNKAQKGVYIQNGKKYVVK